MSPVKAKLVTIIAAFEVDDTVRTGLHHHGIHAYSVGRADGEGTHGPQHAGLVGNANYVYTVVTTEAIAAELLKWADRALVHKHFPAIAYSSDVEAVLPGPLGHKGQ